MDERKGVRGRGRLKVESLKLKVKSQELQGEENKGESWGEESGAGSSATNRQKLEVRV